MPGRRAALFGLLTRAREHRGLALVTVLWVLMLLALIAASFTRTIRTDVNLVRNLIENAQAEALADASVYRAILGLLESDPERALRVDGTVYTWLYGGAEIRIAIQDEGGKLDLNRANDRLMVALFRTAGLSEQEALAMVDRIADFRDPDDLHRAEGAEDPDYAQAGLPWDAKDAPFEAIEELQQVLGMTAEVYERVAPALTLYAGRRPPHEATAPPEVTAFYGVRDLLRARAEAEGTVQEEGPRDEAADLALGPVALEAEGAVPPRSKVPVFTVHAEAQLPGGGIFARAAVVRITGERNAPYELLAWKQARRRLFPLEDAESDGETQGDEDGGS